MLEDKSTQTTIPTYIKVTTPSPTHRHIHILAYTQADQVQLATTTEERDQQCGPDRVLNGTE